MLKKILIIVFFIFSSLAFSHAYSAWLDFKSPDKAPQPGNAMDMSFLLDKPAGKHGFAKVTPEGHFSFEDGTPIRFMSVGLNDKACFPTHELADRMADRFAALGWNMVRFHFGEWPDEVPWVEKDNHFDPHHPKGDTRHMDPERLDRLDYFISALKKRGIYSCILLIQCVRDFHEGDGVDKSNIGTEGSQSTAHASQYFFPRMMDLNTEYFKNLLGHPNAYTHLTLAADPAVALYEIVDENTLFFSFGGEKAAPHGPPGKMLKKMYKEFLGKKHGGKALLPTMVELNSGKPEVRAANEFYYQVQTKFYKDSVAYLRSLGTRAPVGGNSFTDMSPLANAKSCADGLDYLDIHRYFNSEHEENAGAEVSMVKSPFLLTGGDNPLRSMTGTRFKGKPLTLNEWNFNASGNYFFEDETLMATMAAYHGWDGISQWGWTDEINDFGSYVDYSDLTQSGKRSSLSMADRPTNLNQVPMMALLYLRGDVAPCPAKVLSPLSDKDVFNPTCEEGNRFGGRYPHLPSLLPYAVPYVRAFEGVGTDPKPYGSLVDDKEIRSINGSWTWNYARGLFTVNTSKSQVAMGFIGGKIVDLPELKVKSGTPFAVVGVQSLTQDPISKSSRLLVTHVAQEKGFGKKLKIQGVDAEVRIRSNRKGAKVYELDLHGNRRKEIAARWRDGWLVFHVGPAQPSLNTEIIEGVP